MAVKKFIPQIWSARLLQNLQKSLVYGQDFVINRDYEGEISAYGDTVKINNIGSVSIGDYVKDTDMNPPEPLTDDQRTLIIDQAKYFNFQIDDIDQAQSNPKLMDEAMREAAYGLRNTADKFIASNYVDIAAGNTLGTDAEPKEPTANTAYELLVDLGVLLDENNIPEDGRWVIIPPWYEGLMLKDDRFVKTGSLPSEDRLVNGVIGRAAGFLVLKSNNVPFVSAGEGVQGNYKVIAGHRIGWSYAEQINQVEAYRPEKRFADAMKGLHLYGGKVVRPTALTVLCAKRPA